MLQYLVCEKRLVTFAFVWEGPDIELWETALVERAGETHSSCQRRRTTDRDCLCPGLPSELDPFQGPVHTVSGDVLTLGLSEAGQPIK